MALRDVPHVSAIAVTCKLISCSNHSAFFDTNYCWFLLAPNYLFKNPLQTRDVFSRISVMNSESVLHPKTSCKIILMFMWTKHRTANWLKNGNTLPFIWYRSNCYNVQGVFRFVITNIPVTILNVFTVYVVVLLASSLCPQLKQILCWNFVFIFKQLC